LFEAFIFSTDPNAMVGDLGEWKEGQCTFGFEVAEGIISVGVSSYDLINLLLANVVFGGWGVLTI
jgi:hypothetical protein